MLPIEYHEEPNIIPLIMEENRINLSDQSVDLVLMISLYHELDDPEKLLKECLRILKNNGKICIIDWKKEKTEFGPPIDIRYLVENIAKHLKTSGFSDINSDNSLTLHNVLWATKK
ncbi:MAG: methyltransferase domain-containing protein [Spirochaetaceae bacterium]|nr:methyltransferase domain-containing protein [Spirochaetaceae bacterium]